MGMTNMAATIPGFVVPALVGNLTHGVVSFISISYEFKFFLIRRALLKKLSSSFIVNRIVQYLMSLVSHMSIY